MDEKRFWTPPSLKPVAKPNPLPTPEPVKVAPPPPPPAPASVVEAIKEWKKQAVPVVNVEVPAPVEVEETPVEDLVGAPVEVEEAPVEEDRKSKKSKKAKR